MSDLYEEVLQDLEKIIAMEKGLITLKEIHNMPAKTYAPRLKNENG